MNKDGKAADSAPLILVADDTPENRMILQIMLKKEGYRVELAEDGAEALRKIEACAPDLILLDVMMPRYDGFEVCEAIQETKSWAHIPVIFMTALGQTTDKVKAFDVGGVDYIVKPFVMQEILARVRVHIQLKMAMERLQEQAVTDELTGAFNRRFAFEVLSKALQREDRRPERILVTYLDIDNLKKINDGHGHQQGDRLICTVVDGLRTALRSSDYLCRMGGDEFLLIMFDCDEEVCTELMERVRGDLRSLAEWGEPPKFSYGCVSHKTGDSPISAEELICKADSKMYQMKTAEKLPAK